VAIVRGRDDDQAAVGLRDRRAAGRAEHDPGGPADRPVSLRTDRLARYRSARERILPRTSQRVFEALVAEALDDLPPFVQARMENVAGRVPGGATCGARAGRAEEV